MSNRTVYVEPGTVLAATHLAALRTLPVSFTITENPLTAHILAGSAAFMRSAIVDGAAASIAVLVVPRSEPWEDVDDLWAAVEYRKVQVIPATIDVDAMAAQAALVAPIVQSNDPFLVEVHLESLGVEETRLAQVVSLLDALGITCPEVAVRTTASGWVAASNDERMTLRAHCVATPVLAPRIRVRLSSAAMQITIDLPMGADAQRLCTTVATATGTNVVGGDFESPARAFWLALA